MSGSLAVDTDPVAPAQPAAAAQPEVDAGALDAVITDARDGLRARQNPDGHWVFVLEADATIPAEFILFQHYLAEEPDPALSTRIGSYLRNIQNADGGWPLFYQGDNDISATVKAYWALKLLGDDIDAPHMRSARERVHEMGGAARANVLTRFWLALFQQIPWRGVPNMPVEALLLPRWFPFHMSKISYWSRTTLVPMMVLMALKPRAANPSGIDVRELFLSDPMAERRYNVNHRGSLLGEMFLGIDKMLHLAEPYFPRRPREAAIQKAVDYIRPRLNGVDGIGAIFPPMVFSVIMFRELGYPADDPEVATAREAVQKLVDTVDEVTYVQPCVSPVWDTGLAALAMMEAGEPGDSPCIRDSLAWLRSKQITDVDGDYAVWRPHIKPGGWAFQYENAHFPDVDDTAVVVMAMDRANDHECTESVKLATEWIVGMQSKNGGWGAFDADNEHYYLNHIPFADHGALLDPPTADVSARCLGMLAQLGLTRDDGMVRRAIGFLKRDQQEDGSWFGRWGTNYVYGTWSVLNALNAIGEDMNQPYIRRAVDYLRSMQQPDGGWGEDGGTYWEERRGLVKASTASQTAWAVLGLMAAGEVHSEEVRRGIEYLIHAPRSGGEWEEPWYTSVGFPRIFYLRYHGYRSYFPLWALARYRNLKNGNDPFPSYGI